MTNEQMCGRCTAHHAPNILCIGLIGLLASGVLALTLAFLHSDAEAWEGGERRTAVRTTPVEPSDRMAAPTQIIESTNSYLNCRFGVGQRSNPVLSYNVASLNIGWYMDWSAQAAPPRPGGIEYVQVLRLYDNYGEGEDGKYGYLPSGTDLANIIAANPGALWLIGNEPDRIVLQDDVLPQHYARLYHDAYTFIKGLDPTARVSAGGIVQPTPLRMEYLDIVLDTYISLYGEPLPTDAWNIHTYILREASCAAYPGSCWGAEIPPGVDANEGELYELDDTDDLEIFQQRIVEFRQWMRDRGYRDTPLLITEYGTLLPYYNPDELYYDSEGDPFDEARARDFMYSTFDFLLTATDPDVGHPADENRLVQQWLWYSLDDTTYGGALFDRFSLSPMQLGIDFTAAISPTVDLFAADVGQVWPVPYSPTSSVTITLRARVSNVGNVAITRPVTVRFLDGEGHQIGSDQVINETIPGCAEVREATVIWPDLAPGVHVVRAVVDPEGEVSELNEDNNEVYGVVLVAENRAFAPLITRDER